MFSKDYHRKDILKSNLTSFYRCYQTIFISKRDKILRGELLGEAWIHCMEHRVCTKIYEWSPKQEKRVGEQLSLWEEGSMRFFRKNFKSFIACL